MTMQHLIITVVTGFMAVPVLADLPFLNHHAIWSGGDGAEKVTIDLRSDGKCTFIVASSITELLQRVPCTYFVHGGRVRLRAQGERLGDGLSRLEIEHLRESDTLVILGQSPTVLRRAFADL